MKEQMNIIRVVTGTQKSGFTFIEIIVALGLAAILLPALGRAISFSIQVTSQGEKFSEATALAQEDMEAIYYIKSNDPTTWGWTASSPGDGTYQPSKPGTVWLLGSPITVPTVSPAPFTRTVQLTSVNRDVSGTISSTGTLDPNTRFVQVVVSWPEGNTTQKVRLNSYVTNH